MKTYYYPGCTLPNKALDFDRSARACCRILGLELAEMEDWVCCGSSFKLDKENVMQHLAPIRNLVQVHENGGRLMTLCVFCYNTLKRANYMFKQDADKHDVINEFLESDYDGNVQVVHLLEILRDEIGFETLKERIVKPLSGLRIAPFYGCLLLRPHEEIGLDNPENPTIFEDFIRAMGAEAIPYPHRLECCGSYLSIKNGEHTANCVERILESAVKAEANAMVTSCPMCNFNFEHLGRIC